MKILLVDDDKNLSFQVATFLTDAGYLVESANIGEDGVTLALQFGFDLVLLDVTLPDMTGFQVCQSIRKAKSEVPIIFLTGRSDPTAKEQGLDLGADDYVTKPFDARELMARIRAVTRRAAGLVVNELAIGNIKLLSEGRQLFVGDTSLTLTATEFNIVEVLMRRANRPQSAKEIFKMVWPSESEAGSDTVRVHIRILRKKLELLEITNFIKRNNDGYFISNEEH